MRPRTLFAPLAMIALAPALALSGCGQSGPVAVAPAASASPVLPVSLLPDPTGDRQPRMADPVPSEAAEQPTPTSSASEELPEPHPQFARHFTDPLYDDDVEALSPFTSEGGWNMLQTWLDRRSELGRCTTVRWLFDQEDTANVLTDPEHNDVDQDAYVVGAGFTLLRLTGHIDREGKQLVLQALDRTYAHYANFHPREPAVMSRDLRSFPARDC